MSDNNYNELNLNDLEQVSGGKGQVVAATTDGANIRSGPGTSFAVIAKTTKGAQATYANETVFAEGKTWIRVTWSGKTGWICTDYVKKL